MDKRKYTYKVYYFNGTTKFVSMVERSVTKPMTDHEFNKHLRKRKIELKQKGRPFCVELDAR